MHFKFFVYGKLTFKSNFALWSSFQVKFERVVNGLGGQKFQVKFERVVNGLGGQKSSQGSI